MIVFVCYAICEVMENAEHIFVNETHLYIDYLEYDN